MRSANQTPINDNIESVPTLLRTPNGNQPTSSNIPGPMLPTAPPMFFSPPTSHSWRIRAGPASDFQQNHSDNRQQSSQVDTRIDYYEAKITQLNQEIRNLKSSEQQKFFKLETECAKLNDVAIGKNLEMKALKKRLESKNLTLDQEKKELEAKCASLECKLLKKKSKVESLNDLLQSQVATLKNDYESRIRELSQEIRLLKSSEQQKLFNLEAKCTKFNDQYLKKKSDVDTLKSQVIALKNDYESRLTELKLEICRFKSSEKQKLFKLEAECAKLNDVVAGKNLEIKALENRLDSKNLTLDQEKKDLETQLNAELLKKDAEVEALNDMMHSQATALKNNYVFYESRLTELNREICHLKSSEKQKLFNLETQCTKINDALLKKDAKVEALNDLLKTQSLALGQQKDLDQLRAEFDNQQALLQESSQKLRKVEDENSEIAQKLEATKWAAEILQAELDSQSAKNSELMQQLNEAKTISEKLQTELEGRKTELQKCKDQQTKYDEENYKLNFQNNNLKDELDRKEKEMLRLQKLSEKTKAEFETCQAKLENALQDISSAINERDGLKVELVSVSANSRELQAELEKSKKSIEELTIKLEKLKAECTPQPRNLRKFPMNLPGPSFVMPAMRRNTLDLNGTIVLNDTIDLPKNYSDHQMGPPNSKKRKSK